ncbi:MAG TPA: LacI family DNA-binding transcriptional regulator [Gammaproteobacteria bacterium]|nr:LacI family DNA-binding transcriptional regulator [Gammaproteobacteria bacterium]
MSSIREVARIAGVSVATVSRALSNPEKVSRESIKKVQAAIEKVQYRPNMLARNFRSTRAWSIVVLVPDITNPFFSLVIRGIEDQAQQKGYAVLLGDTRDSASREQEYIKLVETRLSDGVIQLRPYSAGMLTKKQEGIAYVSACGCESTPGPSVRIDNAGAARMMVDHLLSLGHRRIGVISGLKENPHTQDRLSGYKQSLAAAGIAFREELIAEGDFTMWSGQNAALHFCKMNPRPTAIFCMNDEMAFGAIQSLKAQGIDVPLDISVTGFDDIPYARHWDPPLTTIAQPAKEIGQAAFDALLKLVEGETLGQRENILPYEFVMRKSTAPAKQG